MSLPVLSALEDRARELLPAAVHDFIASGAGGEITLRESGSAWESFRLRPRVLRDVREVDLHADLLGLHVSSPLGIAPVGYAGLAHPDGEIALATAARRTGSLYVVSTRASRPLEDIAAAVAGPWWFQVYVMRDRGLTRALVERAARSGARALVLTGDTPVVGVKRRVGSTRIAIPDDGFLVNLARHLGGGPTGQEQRAAAEQDPSATLDTIAWLREVSGLPVLVKGVLRPDDAVRCLDAGAAGVVVSNHGGRQLDRSLPAALALADVVDAVAARGPVLVDGGIRSGLDALVALALGARGVLVGRPVVWGLAADGADGAARVLEALHDDLAHVMALVGAPTLTDLDRSLVVPPAAPG